MLMKILPIVCWRNWWFAIPSRSIKSGQRK